MSTTLRKLAQQPNAHLAVEAYLSAVNLNRTGLMTEEQISERLILKTTLAAEDAREAIERGLDSARRKPS